MRKLGGWAASEVADSSDPLQAFQEQLPVHLIATPRPQFSTCTTDETLEAVVARNQQGYDHIPVLGDGELRPIIGLVDVARLVLESKPMTLTVGNLLRPLAEEVLIGADASVLMFIRDADTHPCRLVVSGRTISGLVTLSDLQKLPVRAALFAMVTHLEMVMAEAIRGRYEGASVWKGLLPEARQKKVADQINLAKLNRDFVDELLFTQFCDKVTLLKRHPAFKWDRSEFERDLKRAQQLRDDLAHANDYANDQDRAAAVCHTVRQMDKWIERLGINAL